MNAFYVNLIIKWFIISQVLQTMVSFVAVKWKPCPLNLNEGAALKFSKLIGFI